MIKIKAFGIVNREIIWKRRKITFAAIAVYITAFPSNTASELQRTIDIISVSLRV